MRQKHQTPPKQHDVKKIYTSEEEKADCTNAAHQSLDEHLRNKGYTTWEHMQHIIKNVEDN